MSYPNQHSQYFSQYPGYPEFSSQGPTVDQTMGDDSQGSPASGSVPNRRTRGVSFTTEEDKLLCHAWLETSVDSIDGNDQTSSRFWARIHEWYHTSKRTLDTNRDENSLKHRWHMIQKGVNKFCGEVDKVAGTMSGSHEQDKIDAAKELYRKNNKGVKFPFEHCYNILKFHPKWVQEMTAKGKAAINSSSNVCNPINIDDVDATAQVPLARPPGRNAEKRKKKEREASGASEEYFKEMIQSRAEESQKYLAIMQAQQDQNERMHQMAREQLRMEQEHREAKMERDIMFMNTDGMNPVQLAYIENERKRIMEKRNLM